MTTMRAWAILPVKRFDAAKSRLGEALDGDRRASLAAAMLADVLAALERCRTLDGIVCVTDEPIAIELAADRGAIVLADADEPTHSAAAAIGVEHLIARGVDCAAMVPGDCPLLNPSELDAVIATTEPGTVVVVPDRHGTGTNALVLSPPDAIEPGFGPDSRARHIARADQEAITARAVRIPSMGLDLDTAEDLAALRAELADAPGSAPATAAALEQI